MTLAAFRDFGALLGSDAPIQTDTAYAAATVFSRGERLLAAGSAEIMIDD